MDKIILENTILAMLKDYPGLGSIQINKALISIDAVYHSYYGKTLTGVRYVKHWYGPVPDPEAHLIIYKMGFDKIKIKKEKVGSVTKDAHYALQDPDYAVLTNKAIEIIRDVTMFIYQKKAGRLSEITHDAVYENAKMGEEIPIQSVYEIGIEQSTWTEEDHKEATKALEELERDGVDLSAFC
jgi:hypothetical protein